MSAQSRTFVEPSAPTACRFSFSLTTSFHVAVLPLLVPLPETDFTLPGKVTLTVASTLPP